MRRAPQEGQIRAAYRRRLPASHARTARSGVAVTSASRSDSYPPTGSSSLPPADLGSPWLGHRACYFNASAAFR